MLVCCGLLTLDVVQGVDRLPGPDEKVVARSLDAAFGGPAANAAATAVALGVPARLVAAVGTGPLADAVRADVAAAGVELVEALGPGRARSAAPAVSTVLVTTSTGERAVVSTNATALGPADVVDDPAALLGAVGPGDVLLLDGHLPAVAVPLARQARDAGCVVVLDAGSYKPRTEEILALCDAVVASADFGLPDVGEADLLDAIAAVGPVFVARTHGPDPVEVLDDGVRCVVPVPPARRVVDTLGAGDVVHGAFAASLGQGAGLREALERAVVVASRSVEHPGARGWALGRAHGAARDGSPGTFGGRA